MRAGGDGSGFAGRSGPVADVGMRKRMAAVRIPLAKRTIQNSLPTLAPSDAIKYNRRCGNYSKTKGRTAMADRLLLQELQTVRADWEMYRDAKTREEAWNRFRNYAYQWY
jgi:hypothetical protein